MKLRLDSIRMPVMHIHIKIEKDGKLLEERYERGHSWTRNAYHLFNNFMLDALPSTDLFTRQTSGTFSYTTMNGRQASHAAYGLYNNANNNNFGIAVGTGETAFHLDDWCLETKIAHGNTASCLYYQAQVAPVTTYTGNPDYDLNILHTRIFNNNSGGNITVKEVGLTYCDANYYYFLMSRDVLAVPVVVLNTAQLTVSVSITTQTLSAIDPALPTLGAYGSGGIYIGQFDYGYSNEGGSHRKYGLIIAPAATGQTTCKWADPTQTISIYSYYGASNSAALIALGALSPVGQWITSVNAAAVGGFTDWYVPSRYEVVWLYTIKNYMPAGEEFSNEYYWASTFNSAGSSGVANPTTGATTGIGQTNSYKTRVIRRFLISSWTPL